MARDPLADALADAIGGNDEHQEPKLWLDTGFPPLNRAISGNYFKGLPSGRLIEIMGPSSSGKTAIATELCINAQKAGGIAAWMDHERSFDVRVAVKRGLDVSPGKWVFKTPKTFEQSINTAMKMAKAIRERKLLPDDAPIVCVFDSLASMVPAERMAAVDESLEKGTDEAVNMRLKLALATATSQNFPTLMVFCETYEFTAIFLNQVREMPGVMYGDPTKSPGGKAPEFYATVRIKLGKSALFEKDGGEKKRVGQRVGCEVIKNRVFRPFEKTEWDFLFREDGSGQFDVVGSLIDHLVERGLLEKSGNHIVWDGKKYFRGPLAEKIEEEGALDKLMALLPK